VRTGFTPRDRTAAGTSSPYLASRSKRTNLGADPNGNASRNCWTIPQACRMLCDIEMQDTPTIVTDDKKAIEHAEGDRRNHEEVHRGNRFPVITEKGKPARGRLRISKLPFHPTRDRSLRDIKTEHEKLAMDAWRSPRWILNDHSEDADADVSGRRVVDATPDSRVRGSDARTRGEPAFRGTGR